MTGLRALVIAVAAALMAPAAAGAQPLLAITATNQLLSFDSATPATVTTQSITGLIDPTQSIVGLDRRPATGQVYVVTSAAGAPGPAVTHLYALNPATGQLAFAGDSAAPVSGFGDLAGGLDFNPGVDRLRVVNVNDANLRLNPNTGALAGSDTSISPTSDLVGLAYDVLPAGATASTVFAIDRATSTLVRLGGVGGTPSPNGGVLTTIGPLGVALDPGLDAGFDISPTGTPFVAATTGATTRLFTANLASGALTPVGPIGDGTGEIVGLTALPDPGPLPTGSAGAPGTAGATGPAGAPGAVLFRDRLVTLLADDRLAGRAGRTVTVVVVSTIPATVGLDLRKGTRSVRKVAATVRAGRNRIRITRLPAAGRYTLRLTATGGDQRTIDTGTLTLAR